MDKLKLIQETSSEIGNNPEFKSINFLLGLLKESSPKESKPSALDSLLDKAFDNSVLEEKNGEIQNLKSQLAQRPTLAAYNRLQDEVNALKQNQVGLTPTIGSNAQEKIDRENLLVIFNYLKLPNLAPPVESNLSQFLSTLRTILDRTSTASMARNEPRSS